MSAQHTPVIPPTEVFLDNLKAMDLSLFGMSEMDRPKVEQQIIRIVACINACAGMLSPKHDIDRMKQDIIDATDQYSELERERADIHKNYTELAFRLTDAEQQRDELQKACYEYAKLLLELEQQCDELLELLKRLMNSAPASGWADPNVPTEAMQAIAKQEVV